MDILSDVLRWLSLSGSVLVRCRLGRTFGLAMAAFEVPVFHLVTRGEAWLEMPRRRPLALAAGDVVVVHRGDSHKLVHAPGARTENVVDLALAVGGTCPLVQQGNDTELICGYFRVDGEHPVLRSLPTIMHVTGAGEDIVSTIALVERELAHPRAGAAAKIDRLLGALLIDLLRAFAESLDRPTGWFAALADARIHAALERIHRDVGTTVSLDELAGAAAMSRSAFAARFRTLVGETPMQYLTRWRMQRAAQLLRSEALGVAAVAARVGYESEATFSRAFKRHIGMSPGEYRDQPRDSTRLPLREAAPGRSSEALNHSRSRSRRTSRPRARRWCSRVRSSIDARAPDRR